MSTLIDGAPMPAALEAARLDTPTASAPDKALGQDEFLELMLTQIKHQDPFEPMANGEFIAQMAQFSTVTGIEGMQSSLDDMAGTFGAQQTLQAAELVGDEILVDDNLLPDGAAASGRFTLEQAAADVTLTVTDASGAIVARRTLGDWPAGRHDFAFDGLADDGSALPTGAYRVELSAGTGASQRSLPALVAHRVASVEFGAGGAAILNTDAGHALSLADVREIRAGAEN